MVSLVAISLLVHFIVAPVLSTEDLPRIEVGGDDVRVDRSCRLVIKRDAIEDANKNGLVHIVASGIVVELDSARALRGSAHDTRPDAYEGFGIRIVGQKNVTLRGGSLSGFRSAIYATDSSGLVLEDIDVSDNYRQYLKSTPQAEDGGDWLWPHDNDEHQWLNRYGAAIYIERAENVTVRRCFAREGQNALVLDRVEDSKVYDNDFSFLSGWGLALWRSSRNVITRNAFDFCIRGYSHGVYNRGQDSAGILMFEQCSENLVAENSATHGGDGVFGFAGQEALGARGEHPDEWYRRRGNNDNVFVANDLSYAAAHGLEMTFSFGNKVFDNRMVENAICGIWGGYSSDTWIAENAFERNGDMAYGLERGGVNIEHGQRNRIIHNQFERNKCGVHLWWDPDEGLLAHPWAKVNGADSVGNVIAENEFRHDELAYQLRGPSETFISANGIEGVTKELDRESESQVDEDHGPLAMPALGTLDILGETRPVGAREELRGRENIIMTEWGPWDHESPLVRRFRSDEGHVFEVRNAPEDLQVHLSGSDVKGTWSDDRRFYSVSSQGVGVFPYELAFVGEDCEAQFQETLYRLEWHTTFFSWSEKEDPREDLEAWRALAEGESAVTELLPQLQLPYGGGGPADVALKDKARGRHLGGNHFGMIAQTELVLDPGRWKVQTLSDDGVRVRVGDQTVIENWTWHGPTRNEGVIDITSSDSVLVVVEHFEIDGHAVLELSLTRTE